MEQVNNGSLEINTNSEAEAYEETVKDLLLRATKDSLYSKGLKVRSSFVIEYFKILEEYYKRTDNPEKSKECLTCSEYITLLSSGNIMKDGNKGRWKELMPKINGELSETYKIRYDFEQAVRKATPIKDSPFLSKPPKGFKNGDIPIYDTDK